MPSLFLTMSMSEVAAEQALVSHRRREGFDGNASDRVFLKLGGKWRVLLCDLRFRRKGEAREGSIEFA